MQKNSSALAKYIRQRIDDEYVALKHAKHRYEDILRIIEEEDGKDEASVL